MRGSEAGRLKGRQAIRRGRQTVKTVKKGRWTRMGGDLRQAGYKEGEADCLDSKKRRWTGMGGGSKPGWL